MKKKTIILIVIIVTSIVSIFIWSLAMPSRLVYFGGSSSVNPFMQIATKKFGEEYKHSDEIIYNSNGSQNGVKSVENGTYSAGMISKEVKQNTLSSGSDFSNIQGFDNEFEDTKTFNDFRNEVNKTKGINAMEFAIDAIVIMYNPPKWFIENPEIANSINFDFNKDDHKKIVKKIYSNPNYMWADFVKELNPEIKDFNHGNELLMPVSRESGSGTRSAFDDFFEIEDIDSGTANSNGSMITQLRDTKGSFGYVSYGFYKNSENNNLQTPWFNNKRLSKDEFIEVLNDDGTIQPGESKNEEHIKSDAGYELKRPFIMLFDSENKKTNSVLEFVEFLITEKANSAYEEEGLVRKVQYHKYDLIPND
ncbi:phosphate ABC transporter substrate-binding protein [Spiroplasma endosymbiont of Othius punctulatus]|uniref:phosphate ABC transporter substrate-binding protein n=1 Tax=Spiroplasma endosymbiont of Othius punctulatus TaxID=3066289 RepID=UPI0030CE5DCB